MSQAVVNLRISNVETKVWQQVCVGTSSRAVSAINRTAPLTKHLYVLSDVGRRLRAECGQEAQRDHGVKLAKVSKNHTGYNKARIFISIM